MTEYAHVWQAWQRCAACLLPPATEGSSLVTTLYDRYIVARYTESQRHYHTMAHIEHMFALLAEYKALRRSQETLELRARRTDWSPLVTDLAILFHDAVYDPRARDNEAQSAQWARAFLDEARVHCGQSAVAHTRHTASDACTGLAAASHVSLLWSDEAGTAAVTASVASFIMHTADHLAVPVLPLTSSVADAEEAVGEEDDDALHVFLDLDLAILGSADVDYARYAEAVRREYGFYTKDEYRRGRSDFLARLQRHPRWYKTPYFHSRLEARARHNVAEELRQLRARRAAA